ncbi:tRNA-binding protein Pbp11 [Thermococcus sp. P6]|uniref:tRNA-binding protein Pbp11 n=1 Tax=Thermococcus sp. P6 TaxID=122420 RepID=UPI001E2A737D|nr:tRNA-binding protein Pbp11 [Thermococcus sp. P6]
MKLRLLKRIFRRGENTEVASREPVGRFRVEESLKTPSGPVLVGEVVEGLIYPGYKVRGKGVSPIMWMELDGRRVDFAVEGDRVAITLEKWIPCEEGEELEVYRS